MYYSYIFVFFLMFYIYLFFVLQLCIFQHFLFIYKCFLLFCRIFVSFLIKCFSNLCTCVHFSLTSQTCFYCFLYYDWTICIYLCLISLYLSCSLMSSFIFCIIFTYILHHPPHLILILLNHISTPFFSETALHQSDSLSVCELVYVGVPVSHAANN